MAIFTIWFIDSRYGIQSFEKSILAFTKRCYNEKDEDQ